MCVFFPSFVRVHILILFFFVHKPLAYGIFVQQIAGFKYIYYIYVYICMYKLTYVIIVHNHWLPFFVFVFCVYQIAYFSGLTSVHCFVCVCVWLVHIVRVYEFHATYYTLLSNTSAPAVLKKRTPKLNYTYYLNMHHISSNRERRNGNRLHKHNKPISIIVICGAHQIVAPQHSRL